MIKTVYLNSLNPTQVTFYKSGAAIDFSAITRMTVSFRESAEVIDSATNPEMFDWSAGGGVVDFIFGESVLVEGVYTLLIKMFDTTHPYPDGQVLVGFDADLRFRFVGDYDFELVVQDDVGSQANANGYITIDYFKTYHKQRGYFGYDHDDFQIKQAIVLATDFADIRFEYVSFPLTDTQNTAWPRYGFDTIPRALKEAVAEYAKRALIQNINPDPENLSGGRLVKKKSEGLTPMSESVEFDNSSGVFMMPNYPAADEKLKAAGLLASSQNGVNWLQRG